MNGEKGFTYPAALALIVVTGISLMTAQQQWSTLKKKEMEQELLFRGTQIRNAIESYYQETVNGSHSYPVTLSDLLRDARFQVPKRHLRKLYKDPITETAEWGLVLTSGNRIKGVYSKSKAKPFKTENFEKMNAEFSGKSTYSDWKFTFSPS